MTAKVETQRNWGELLKWALVAALLVGGVVADHYYITLAWPLRLVGWLFLLSVIIAIAAITSQGRAFFGFMREARIELRKVVWPTRQETLQITLSVAVVVLVLAVFLWGLDSVLLWLMGWLTGQRS